MRVLYVNQNEAEFIALVEAQEKEGYQWAATSNTGLKGTGKLRVTFLPKSAFKDKSVAPEGEDRGPPRA